MRSGSPAHSPRIAGRARQLTVDGRAHRRRPAVLQAVVSREFSARPADVSLAVRFAEASLRHAPEADDLRQEVVRRWGKRALISRFRHHRRRIFPTVKYAMALGSRAEAEEVVQDATCAGTRSIPLRSNSRAATSVR